MRWKSSWAKSNIRRPSRSRRLTRIVLNSGRWHAAPEIEASCMSTWEDQNPEAFLGDPGSTLRDGTMVPCLDRGFGGIPSVFEGTSVRQAWLVDQRAEGFAEFFREFDSGNPGLRLFLESVKNLRGRLCPPTEDPFPRGGTDR